MNVTQLLARLQEARRRLRGRREGPHAVADAAVLAELGDAMDAMEAALAALRERNAALSEARHRVGVEQNRYRELFDSAPDAYFVTDVDGVIREANIAAAQMLKIDLKYLHGKPLAVFVCPEHRKEARSMLNRLKYGEIERLRDWDARIQPRHGAPVDVSVEAAIIRSADEPDAIRWLVRDISRRKEDERKIRELNAGLEDKVAQRTGELESANRDLRDSQAQYHALLEHISDVMYSINTAGVITYVNSQVSLYGWRPEQLLGRPFPELVHPDDRRRVIAEFTQSLTTGQSVPSAFRVMGGRGQVYWVEDRSRIECGPDGQIVGLVGILRDITDRVRAEEQIRGYQRQLQTLGFELYMAEERERRRLATELHDGLSQVLNVANMRLHVLRDLKGLDRKARAEITAIAGLIHQAERVSRSLTLDLSPPALYELGLSPALSGLAEEIGNQYGLAVTLDARTVGKDLAERTRVLLYRAVRELLVNAAKHAGVQQADVRVEEHNGSLRVSVKDRGEGFDVAEAAKTGGGYGLFSIRERIAQLGGRMEIESAPGQGTTVSLSVPAHA